MEETLDTQQDIRESQQIADNTNGTGTTQLYQDFMSGKKSEKSLLASEATWLEAEDMMRNAVPPTSANSNDLRLLSNAVAGNKSTYRLPDDYGKSRQDRKIYNPSMLKDLNESRAILQSDGSKVFNGLVKGIGTFATTAVDSIGVGLIASLGEIIRQAATGGFKLQPGETDEDRWNRIQYNVQNNAFQRACNDFNNWLEEIAPNYYRAGEQDLTFWQSLGNANFWGNDVIKNLGFMVGAIAGSVVSGSALGSVFKLNSSRNVVNAAVKAYKAESGVKAAINARSIASAFASGKAEISGMKITKELGKAANKAVRNEFIMMALNGAIASDVEARQEGSQNAAEFVKNTHARLDEMKQLEKDNIDSRLQEADPDLFILAPDDNPKNGEFRGRMTRQVNPERFEEYTKLRAEMEAQIDQRYANQDAIVMDEAMKYANADYWANMPVLYADNLLMWGSFLKGSYKTGRIVNGMVKADKMGKPVLNKAAKVWGYAKGIGSPIYEASQEMIQEDISQAANRRASARLNTFYGSAFDPEVNAELAEGIQGFLQYVPKSFIEGFSDPNTMKQFYIGGLTAMLGMPSFKHVSRATNTRAKARYEEMTAEEKRKWHEENREKGKLGAFFKEHVFSLEGEMFNSFRETSEQWREAKDLVERYNDIVNNDRFKTVLQGVARGNVILRDMDNAVVAGDKNAYITEQEKQLLNIVDTYQRLGRTDELKDAIESFRKSDIGEIREFSRGADGVSTYDNVSDEQMRKNIDKWADGLEHTIGKYTDIMGSLKLLYGNNISDSVMTELTWQTFHLDNLNERFTDSYNKIHDYLFGAKGVLNGRTDGLFGEKLSDKEIEDIEKLRVTDAKTLLEIASSKEVYDTVASLGRLLDENGKISPEYLELQKMSGDLLKLYNERGQFANNYLALAGDYKNMEKFDTDLLMEVDDARIRSAIAPYVAGKMSFANPYDLTNFLSQYSELDSFRILDALSEYSQFKDLVDRTRKWSGAVVRLNNAMSVAGKNSPFKSQVSKKIASIIQSSQSAEEMRAALEAYANSAGITDGERSLVREIIDKYDEITKTGKLQEADPMSDTRTEGGRGEGTKAKGPDGSAQNTGKAQDMSDKQGELSDIENAFNEIVNASDAKDIDKALENAKKSDSISESDMKKLEKIAEERKKDIAANHNISRAEPSTSGDNAGISSISDSEANFVPTSASRGLFSVTDFSRITDMKVKDVLSSTALPFVWSGKLYQAWKKNPNMKVRFVKLKGRTGDVVYTAIESKEGTVSSVIDGKNVKLQIIGVLNAADGSAASKSLYSSVQSAFDSEFRDTSSDVQVLEGMHTTINGITGGTLRRLGNGVKMVLPDSFDPESSEIVVVSPDGAVTTLSGKLIDKSQIHGISSVSVDGTENKGALFLAVKGADGKWQLREIGFNTFGQIAGAMSAESDLKKKLTKLTDILNDKNGKSQADRLEAAYELSKYIALSASQIYAASMETDDIRSRLSGVRFRLDDRMTGGMVKDYMNSGVFVTQTESSRTAAPRVTLDNPVASSPDAKTGEPKMPKREEKKPAEEKKQPEQKMGAGEGTRKKMINSKWNGDFIHAEFTFDSMGNLVEEKYKKNHKEVTDKEEIATIHFVYQCKRQLGALPMTYRPDVPGNGFVTTLPSGKQIMYYEDKHGNARWSTEKSQIDAWKAELDAMADAAAKEKAMDGLEEKMDKDSGKEETSPQLDDEQKEEQEKANEYNAAQEHVPPYTTVQYKGKTYGVFEDGTVVNMEFLDIEDLDTYYIDKHKVTNPAMKKAIQAEAGKNGSVFNAVNDSKDETVPDNETDNAAQASGKAEQEGMQDPLDRDTDKIGSAVRVAGTMTVGNTMNMQTDQFRGGVRGITAKDGSKPFEGIADEDFRNGIKFVMKWDEMAAKFNREHPGSHIKMSEEFKDYNEMMSEIDDLIGCGI